MAKGQLRSNREPRKPKKPKAPATAAPAPFASAIKQASESTSTGTKRKG